jgi:hypothetical protein
MSPKDIHDDFMDTLWKKSPSYSTVKKRNLKAAGKAVEMLSSLCGQKRQPTMKQPKLCTIWSCATEGDTFEALLG